MLCDKSIKIPKKKKKKSHPGWNGIPSGEDKATLP